MAPLFNNRKEDSVRKELSEDLQNLSEQIGQLRQELNQRNAEIERMKQQENQARTRDQQQDSEQARKFQEAQARVRALEAQIAQAESYPQPPTAAAQPSQTTPQPNELPGQAVTATSSNGLRAGITAYVAQAGGLPLRLRSRPGLAKDTVLDKLPPGTQMTLLEGPQQADGYSWWHIRTTDGREGWVAGEDLRTRPE
jgi:TolA-binding protein